MEMLNRTVAKLDQEGIPNGTNKLPTEEHDHGTFDSDSEVELKKIEEIFGGPEPSRADFEALTPPQTTPVLATWVTGSITASVIKVPASVSLGLVASSAQGGEEDRRYTPCLDEKYQEGRREHDRNVTTPELSMMESPEEGIDGMDTELISDEDENTFKEDEMTVASTSKATSSGARKKDVTFKKVNKKGKERYYRGEPETKKKDRN